MKFDKFEKNTLVKSGLGASNLSLLFKFNEKGAK
jgi:hypothetical protein